MQGGAHQDLKRETPVIAQQGLDGVEVEHELREAAGSVLLGQMRIPWAGKEEHLRERGLCSLVRCLQRGEDPACGQGKQGGQQTGAPGRERNGAPGVLIWPPTGSRCGVARKAPLHAPDRVVERRGGTASGLSLIHI